MDESTLAVLLKELWALKINRFQDEKKRFEDGLMS